MSHRSTVSDNIRHNRIILINIEAASRLTRWARGRVARFNKATYYYYIAYIYTYIYIHFDCVCIGERGALKILDKRRYKRLQLIRRCSPRQPTSPPLKFPASLRNLLSNLQAFQSISADFDNIRVCILFFRFLLPFSLSLSIYISRRWHVRNCAHVKNESSGRGQRVKSCIYNTGRTRTSRVVSTIYAADSPVWGKASFLLNRFFN